MTQAYSIVGGVTWSWRTIATGCWRHYERSTRPLLPLLPHPCRTMTATILLFVCLIPQVFGEAGMAELKAITGDEPYSGLGPNPPQPIPQPMGFWGRPRYSPIGYYGGRQYMGGINPYYYGGGGGGGGVGRFTSVGHSPYGEDGQHPFDGQFPNFGADALVPSLFQTLFGRPPFSPSSPSSFQPSFSRRNNPSPFQSSFSSTDNFFDSGRTSPFSSNAHRNAPSPFASERTSRPFSAGAPLIESSPSDTFSLSSATGGFYKGKGNEMVGR